MSHPNSSRLDRPMNVVWHQGSVDVDFRQQLLGQKPLTVWLTGLSGSGKSTLAMALEHRLIGEGRACFALDGDNVRHGLNRDLGFSPEDRQENIRRVAEVSKLMNDAGLIVVTAFISPYRADRAMAEEIIGKDLFTEVHVCTSLEVCEQRDPKGLYKRARQGEMKGLTGIDAPYEAPEKPAMAIDTRATGVDDCVEQLLTLTRKRFTWG